MVDKVYQEFEDAVVKAEEVRKEEEPTVIPDGILCF
jgi:hypothetical protein